MNTLIPQFKKVTPLCLIVFALGCLALLPRAQAISPPPDGDYSTGDTAQGLGDNTAVGADTLCDMMMLSNTPYGCHALEGNTTGRNNTAIGFNALEGNTMGNNNTAIGFLALENAMGNNNTAIGNTALYYTTGSGNIALGTRAGVYHVAGNNNIYIGNPGIMASEEGQIRIGAFGSHTATYIAGIRNAAVTGSPVVIGMGGRLGVTMSSAQFKEAIKPMDKASEAILALKPVTFHYKKEVDPDGIPQFGLVAEQVEKVNPDLVARDEEGKVYTVRYEAVNAMLLNEFLKEHRKNEEQETTIAHLKRDSAQQEKQIEALTAALQKVSAQIELSKPAPQTVLNSQ
jgi:trimeric autotransporter adhesin